MREGIKVTEEQAAKIERETRGQSQNPRWKEERKPRVTASRFGEICRATDARDLDKLAQDIYDPPNLDHVLSIKHGKLYEQSAIEAFMAKTEKEVTGCGLFIDPRFPFLGASPDGIIKNENAVVEIKCPYSGRQQMIKPGKHFPFLEVKEGEPDKYQLKRSHHHYYQVTAEMMLARRSTCYYVVYTLAPDIFVEEIKLDEEFFTSEMLPKLHEFFEQHYFPILVANITK